MFRVHLVSLKPVTTISQTCATLSADEWGRCFKKLCETPSVNWRSLVPFWKFCIKCKTLMQTYFPCENCWWLYQVFCSKVSYLPTFSCCLNTIYTNFTIFTQIMKEDNNSLTANMSNCTNIVKDNQYRLLLCQPWKKVPRQILVSCWVSRKVPDHCDTLSSFSPFVPVMYFICK